MEGMKHAVVTQTFPVGVDKPMGNLSSNKKLFAACPIIGQDLESCCMQWNQAGLAELGGAYCQNAVVEINVVHGETKRFAYA
jgi:hypothetical protein